MLQVLPAGDDVNLVWLYEGKPKTRNLDLLTSICHSPWANSRCRTPFNDRFTRPRSIGVYLPSGLRSGIESLVVVLGRDNDSCSFISLFFKVLRQRDCDKKSYCCHLTKSGVNYRRDVPNSLMKIQLPSSLHPIMYMLHLAVVKAVCLLMILLLQSSFQTFGIFPGIHLTSLKHTLASH